jgi:hypothetical protein
MAMSDMDELLAQLKAEYGQPKPPKTDSDLAPSPTKPEFAKDSKPVLSPEITSPQEDLTKANAASNPLDRLLADVKAEVESTNNASPKRVLPQSATPKSPNKMGQNNASHSSSQIDARLLAELQQEQQQQELEAQRQRQQELAAEQTRQTQKTQRRKAALQQEARDWLQKLNPKSDEGRWFEEFAYSYESKLAAAIDYLQAMKESGL